MIRFTFIIFAMSILSCGQNPKGSASNQSERQLPQIDRNFLEQQRIIHSIKEYYHQQYSQNGKIEENVKDTLLEIVYYSNPATDDEMENFLMTIDIPLHSNFDLYQAKPIIMGDLNHDGVSDLVVAVHTEGGGSGGNISWQDIFVFIQENGTFKLSGVASDPDLTDCGGIFRAKSISENYLIGEMWCYTDDDASCCPSLHYEAKIVFRKETLLFDSKRKL